MNFYQKRLLKLADALDNINRKNFDLDNILNLDINYNLDTDIVLQKSFEEIKKLKKIGKKEKIKCTSTACAIGWTPVVFHRHFKWNTEDQFVQLKSIDKEDFDAVIDFFNISRDSCDYLFMPNYYPRSKRGPKSVANRIRNFVKSNGVYIKNYY